MWAGGTFCFCTKLTKSIHGWAALRQSLGLLAEWRVEQVASTHLSGIARHQAQRFPAMIPTWELEDIIYNLEQDKLLGADF